MVSRQDVRERARAAVSRASDVADRAKAAARNRRAKKKLESFRSDEVTDQATARRQRARQEAKEEATREARKEALDELKQDVKADVKQQKRREFQDDAGGDGITGALSRFAGKLADANERQRELDDEGEFGDTFGFTSDVAFGDNPPRGTPSEDTVPGLDVEPDSFGEDMGFDPSRIDDAPDFDPDGMGDGSMGFDPDGMGDGSMGFDPDKMGDGGMEFDTDTGDDDDPFGGLL